MKRRVLLWTLLCLAAACAILVLAVRFAYLAAQHIAAGDQVCYIALRVAEEVKRRQNDTRRPEDLVAGIVNELDGPPQLIIRDADHRLIDPWGNPISVGIKRRGSVVYVEARGAGPDGVMGTDDDKVYEGVIDTHAGSDERN